MVQFVSPTTRIVTNAGASTSYGLELEGRAKVTDELTLTAGYGYTHAKFDQFVDPILGVNYSGQDIPFAPRHSLSAGVDWRHAMEGGFTLFAGASYAYKSSYLFTPSSTYRQAPVSLVDARIGVERGPFSVSIYGKNLLDERYLNGFFETRGVAYGSAAPGPHVRRHGKGDVVMVAVEDVQGSSGAEPRRQIGVIVVVGALFITQGIPTGLIFEGAAALLRAEGASLSVTGSLPLLMLPWVFKFLWAPAVDNHWSTRIGRRKTWILPLQTALAISIATLAFLGSPAANVMPFFICLGLASLFGATQDIATDGLAAERLRGSALACANGFQIGGFVVGMMIGGPLTLFVSSRYGTPAAFALAAACVALALVRSCCGASRPFVPATGHGQVSTAS